MVFLTLIFLCATGLIFHQTILSTLFYLAIIFLLFVAIHLCSSLGILIKQGVKKTGVIFIQAAPIAVILFIVMPKLPPLWQMPAPESTETGLSETMTPGDIASLAKSDELVFRADFDGNIPAPSERYWRTIVLDYFDGKTWSVSNDIQELKPALTSAEKVGRAVNYSIIAESSASNWLYSLDIPDQVTVSSGRVIKQQSEYQLRLDIPLHSQQQYTLTSYLDAPLKWRSAYTHTQYLQVPQSGNPRTTEWVAAALDDSPSRSEYIKRVAEHFISQPFEYTLQPPIMQANPVDQFLFDYQQGFCSHYAGAFAYMMRLGGVPTRIVTGYQGGEQQSDSVLSVFQYDAHAWIEVWDDIEGWQRIDPTSIVAPNRVLSGLQSALNNQEEFLSDSPFSMSHFKHFPVLNEIRLFMAHVDYMWSHTILGFNEDSQSKLLSDWFGDITYQKMVGIILGGGLLITFMLVLYFTPFKHDYINDADKWIKKSHKLLAKKNIKRNKSETIHHFSRRLTTMTNRSAAEAYVQLVEQYTTFAYAQNMNEQQANIYMKSSYKRLKQAL